MNFSGLKQAALNKAGSYEILAGVLDLSPSDLSKRWNGSVGWREEEINKLLEYVGYEIMNPQEITRKYHTLKEAMKILINDGEGSSEGRL